MQGSDNDEIWDTELIKLASAQGEGMDGLFDQEIYAIPEMLGTLEKKKNRHSNSSSTSTDSSKDNPSVKIEIGPEIWECPVCFTEYEGEKEKVQLPEGYCAHKYCKSCMRSYLGQQIGDKKAKINCPTPDCPTIFPEEFLEHLCSEDEELLRLLHERKRREELHHNPNARWCPRAGCGNGVVGDPSVLHLVCDRCGEEWCFDCGEEWDMHEGRTCAETEAQLIRTGKVNAKDVQWNRKNGVKKCPQCKIEFKKEKNLGCNHITCMNPNCGYEFCYLCMRMYTPDHYDANNWANGCPNQCITLVPTRRQRFAAACRSCGKLSLCACLSIVAFPFVLLGLPFFCCYRCFCK